MERAAGKADEPKVGDPIVRHGLCCMIISMPGKVLVTYCLAGPFKKK